MVSYEGAGDDSVDCYLAEQLHPLQPVILWGRTANIAPIVDREHAVYYWWLEFTVTKQGVPLSTLQQSGSRPLNLGLCGLPW